MGTQKKPKYTLRGGAEETLSFAYAPHSGFMILNYKEGRNYPLTISLEHMKDIRYESLQIPAGVDFAVPLEIAREVWRILALPCVKSDGTEEKGWTQDDA